MPRSLQTRFRLPATLVLLFLAVLTFPHLGAQTPQDPPPSTPQQTPAPSAVSSTPASNSSSEEVSSRDTPPTFKVRVNLVLVRAVVRDANGNVISNLKKEDFQLF